MRALSRPGRRVLVVAAASRRGATAAIADRLARVILAGLPSCWSVRTPDLADLRVLDGADAVVLGSTLHLGHWLRPALALRRQAQDAQLLGLWLFSTGSISHDLGRHRLVVSADDLVDAGRANDHQVFARSVDVSPWRRWPSPGGEVMPELHHDWASIDAWGGSISSQLAGAASGPDVPPGRVRRPWVDRTRRTTLDIEPPTESRFS